MSTIETIKEVNAIKLDFLAGKLVFGEAIENLKTLSLNTGVDFSNLYNAFFSSNPAIYIN